MSSPMTPVREQALLLLDVAEREGRTMRLSNETNANAGYLHWKTAGWLIDNGLVEQTRQPHGEYLALTPAGRDVVATLKTTKD